MGKAGRFACIFIPMALTIASLVSLVFVFLGNREAHNSTTNNLYFFRVDATNFTQNPNIDLLKSSNSGNALLNALVGQLNAGNISDVYQVGLFDYCQGNHTTSNSTSPLNLTFCSKPESSYFFNFTEVWNLQNSEGVASEIPKTLTDAEKAYKAVAHWMFIAYAVALATTAAEILVGFLAIFSRWGSCVTTLISSASTFFTIAASITATALTSVIVGALNTTLRPYGIKTHFGTRMLAVTWLAVAFSLVAGLFWTFSTCCCSGKSGYKRDGGIRRQGTLVERGMYTHEYKPISEPFGSAAYAQHHGQHDSFGGHQQGVPMQNFGEGQQYGHTGGHGHQSGAYEPYRTV